MSVKDPLSCVVQLGAPEHDDGEDVGGDNSTDQIRNSMHESVVEEPVRHLHTGRWFRFGLNWTHFLKHVDKAQTAKAEDNLSESVGRYFLVGKTFLDIGYDPGSRPLQIAASVQS
jgi:hypothetical protein